MIRVLTWTKAHYGWVAAGLGYVAVFAVGYAAHKPGVVTVTEYKDRVVTQEKVVTVEKPIVEYRDRVITRFVTRPDGTKIETHVTEESGKETGEKVTTKAAETQHESTTYTQTTPVEPPRLHGYIEVAAGTPADFFHPTFAFTVVGGVNYDLLRLGPASLYVGGSVTLPITPTVVPPILQATVGLGF